MAVLVDEARESVLEDVKVVLEFAREEKLVGSRPQKGNRSVYTPAEAEDKFKEKLDFKGVAGNFFELNLDKWAVKGQSVPRHAAKTYGEQHVIPSALSQDTYNMLRDPIGVAVVSATSPGASGSWRRISLDLQTMGFIVSWADLIRKKPFDQQTKKLIEQFKKASLHCPMDFYYFEASADLESRIFKKSFEIM